MVYHTVLSDNIFSWQSLEQQYNFRQFYSIVGNPLRKKETDKTKVIEVTIKIIIANLHLTYLQNPFQWSKIVRYVRENVCVIWKPIVKSTAFMLSNSNSMEGMLQLELFGNWLPCNVIPCLYPSVWILPCGREILFSWGNTYLSLFEKLFRHSGSAV